MTRLMSAELLVGLLALSTAWGFHSSWQASDRVFKPLEVVREPEIIAAPEASPTLPPVEDEVVSDSLPPAPAVSLPLQPTVAQSEQPVIGPDVGTAATAVPLPSRDAADAGSRPAASPVSAAGAMAVQDGARRHVQAAFCDNLQEALAVAERLQSAGYSVTLSNAGLRYQVALATDFDTATASRLVQVLQHAGFRAELVP